MTVVHGVMAGEMNIGTPPVNKKSVQYNSVTGSQEMFDRAYPNKQTGTLE